MKNINWTFVFCFLTVGYGAISIALGLTDVIDKKSELKKELSITHNRVKSGCQFSNKEKKFDRGGGMTITEKYSCADGVDYSFSIPSESN